MKYSWSFPTSPRNPAKIPVELNVLEPLCVQLKLQKTRWGHESQVSYGQALRNMEPKRDRPLVFQKQADVLSEKSLAWTARARVGSYKHLGFAHVKDGYLELTDAGKRIIKTHRPDLVMLKQLIKLQYPSNQHNRNEFPRGVYKLFPFIATASLVRDMDGLSKKEIALFLFTMKRNEDVAQVRKNISLFRQQYSEATGKVAKRRFTATTRRELKIEKEAIGQKVPYNSFLDYADAFGRYMLFTKLFSLRRDKIVIAKGREQEVEEIIALQGDLYPFEDAAIFYAYFGDPDLPQLNTDTNAEVLKEQITQIYNDIFNIKKELSILIRGQARIPIPETPRKVLECSDIEKLRDIIEKLREYQKKIALNLLLIKGKGPERLIEAITFYDNILSHQTFDDASYLEWNTWRVFVALNEALEVRPNLLLDEALEPLNTAPGNMSDIEIYYPGFNLIIEVTMRTRVDQSYYETFPVKRHLEDFMKKTEQREGYGLFLPPKCHQDTVFQFFVAWKYGTSDDKNSKMRILPLTIEQFKDIVSVFTSKGFKHTYLLELYGLAELSLNNTNDSKVWYVSIQNLLREWERSLRDSVDMPPLP